MNKEDKKNEGLEIFPAGPTVRKSNQLLLYPNDSIDFSAIGKRRINYCLGYLFVSLKKKPFKCANRKHINRRDNHV